jgi:hypothetical protein
VINLGESIKEKHLTKMASNTKNIYAILRVIGWGFVGFLSINVIIKIVQTISQRHILENPLIPKYLYGYTISLEVFQLFLLCILISLCIVGIKRNKFFLIPIAIIVYFFIPQMTLLFDKLIYGLFISN